MEIDRHDRYSLPDPVSGPVLPGRGVEPDAHSDDDRQDGGSDHQLCRRPHPVTDLIVDAVAQRGRSPVPVKDDAGDPSPPPFRHRLGGTEVERHENVLDLSVAQWWAPSHEIRAWVEKDGGEEPCEVRRDDDHGEPPGGTPQDVSGHRPSVGSFRTVRCGGELSSRTSVRRLWFPFLFSWEGISGRFRDD